MKKKVTRLEIIITLLSALLLLLSPSFPLKRLRLGGVPQQLQHLLVRRQLRGRLPVHVLRRGVGPGPQHLGDLRRVVLPRCHQQQQVDGGEAGRLHPVEAAVVSIDGEHAHVLEVEVDVVLAEVLALVGGAVDALFFFGFGF